MNKRSIGTIIMLSIFTLLTICAVVLIISFSSNSRAQITANEFSEYIVPILDNATIIMEEIGNMSISSNQFSFTNDVDDYNKTLQNIELVNKTNEVISGLMYKSVAFSNEFLKYNEDIKQNMINYRKIIDNTRIISNNIDQSLASLLDTADSISNMILQTAEFLEDEQLINYKKMSSQEFTQYLEESQLVELSALAISNLKAATKLAEAVTSKDLEEMNVIEPFIKDFENRMRNLIATAETPNARKSMKALEDANNKNVSTAARLVALLENLEKENLERSKVEDNIAQDLQDLATLISSVANTQTGNLSKLINTVKIVIIVSGLLLIFVSIGIILLINKSVVKNLKEFVTIVRDLTDGDGDLTKRIPVSGNNEIAQLGTSFNKFIENIHDIIIETKEASDDVASGNNQLAATMEELSSTFNNQSEQISSVAISMDTMRRTSNSVVSGLTSNMHQMNDTETVVNQGSKQLNGVMNNMESIQNQTTKLSATITSLSESSSKIGEILNVINDIADQTNLLALNAAIEAARAGEAGRGFAVVADEVRKLAERTQTSTSEISEIISNLQKESKTASFEMENATSAVNSGIDSIEKTNELFQNVVETVKSINISTHDSSDMVGEQFKMIENINDNTHSISSGIEESVQAINDVASTVSHLQQRAERLKSIVSQFKI